MSKLVLTWCVPCSTLALLCALSIGSTARTFSLAAVLTATGSRWSLSFSQRNAAHVAGGCHDSSIGLMLAKFLCYDNTQRAGALVLSHVVGLRNDIRFRAPLRPKFTYVQNTRGLKVTGQSSSEIFTTKTVSYFSPTVHASKKLTRTT